LKVKNNATLKKVTQQFSSVLNEYHTKTIWRGISVLIIEERVNMKRSFFVLVIILGISVFLLGCNLSTLLKGVIPEKNVTEAPNVVVTTSKTTPEVTNSITVVTETPDQTPNTSPDIGSTQVSQKDGMTMVYVPAGDFLMGSVSGVGNANEHPQNTQNVDAFWIDQTEVTNSMFALFIKDTKNKTDAEIAKQSYSFVNDKWQLVEGADWAHPFGPTTTISGFENYPVALVSWKDAFAYCEWVGRTLPTEAQWEKAARGTNGSIYPWGDAVPSGDLVNFADSSSHFSTSDKTINDGYEFSAPVGSFPKGASVYRALDIAGNVWEWVSSLAQGYPYSATDGRENPTPVGKRLIRGGSWFDAPVSLRAADRYEFDQTYTGLNTGFRCALPIQ
jgi:formylglycine-generating enzyme required for sulfatase activity